MFYPKCTIKFLLSSPHTFMTQDGGESKDLEVRVPNPGSVSR